MIERFIISMTKFFLLVCIVFYPFKLIADVTLCPKQNPVRPLPIWNFCEPAGVYQWPKQYQPTGAKPVVVDSDYLYDFDPLGVTSPPIDGKGSYVFASPGEEEPASFLLIAGKEAPLTNVRISISPLQFGNQTISADKTVARRVVRTPRRKFYPVSKSNHDFSTVGRYLPKWKSQSMGPGQFRQVWLTISVPPVTLPGIYRGNVLIQYVQNGQELYREWPLEVEVLPIKLFESYGKAAGLYYPLDARLRAGREDLARVELRDLFAHGVRHLNTGLQVRYVKDANGSVNYDLSRVKKGLELIKSVKAEGISFQSIVVQPNLNQLARVLNHSDVVVIDPVTQKKTIGDGASLDQDKLFAEKAEAAIKDLEQLASHYPFRVFFQNLDEIFDSRYNTDPQHPNLVLLYSRYASLCKRVSSVKLTTTISSFRLVEDSYRRQVSDLLDIRSHHGYSFEWWLAKAGNSIDTYRSELKAAKAEAWFYHNERGAYHTAAWQRIIGGVFLWSSPFLVHNPWTYHTFSGNPFDDTNTSDELSKKFGAFGFAFPAGTGSLESEIVPTTSWEALREGWDDVRYFHTLKVLSAQFRVKPLPRDLAEEIRQFLNSLERLVTGIDLSNYKPTSGSALESPIISALEKQMQGKGLQRLRREAIDLILRIQNE